MKILAIHGLAKSGKDTIANYLVTKGYTKVAFADPLKDLVAKEYNIPREWLDDVSKKDSPLEQYPVLPKDEFSRMLARSLATDFRSITGKRPMETMFDVSGAFIGIMGPQEVGQLYHTPRTLAILKGNTNRFVSNSYWTDKVINRIDTMYANIKTAAPGLKYLTNDKFVVSDLRFKHELKVLQQTYGKDLITIKVNRFANNPSADVSENDLTNTSFDYTINNIGTLEDLYKQVDLIIN